MAKKPALTMDMLKQAASLDDLPSLAPLIAEHQRLTDAREALIKEVDDAFERMGRNAYLSNTPRMPPRTAEEFDRLTDLVKNGRQQVERLGYQIAEVQQRMTAERDRLIAEIKVIRHSRFSDVVPRLMKALEQVSPIEAELRDEESLFNRFIPFSGTIKPRRTADELRQLAGYVQRQTTH